MNRLFILLVLLLKLVYFTRCQETCSDYDNALIPDCNCKSQTVERAVVDVIKPLLANITASKYFRYFFVDLEKPCPFWQEEGLCMMEGCSVCTCSDDEIPLPWLQAERDKEEQIENQKDYGWVSEQSSAYGFEGEKGEDESLGKVTVHSSADAADIAAAALSPLLSPGLIASDATDGVEVSSGIDLSTARHMNQLQKQSQSYLQHLHATEDCDSLHDWTTVGEEEGRSMAEVGVYVNLLENPERFTGYRGAPARRVWQAIAEENCFLSPTSLYIPSSSASSSSSGSSAVSGYGDVLIDVHREEKHAACLEQRVFDRVISGLRASITAHIAKEYLNPPPYPSDTSSTGPATLAQQLSQLFTASASHAYGDQPFHGARETDRWAPNIPLFAEHLAAHPQRLQHMYFTFLFTLRAVSKALQQGLLQPPLVNYDTGDALEDQRLQMLIAQLVTALSHHNHSQNHLDDSHVTTFNESVVNAEESEYNSNYFTQQQQHQRQQQRQEETLQQCATAFDETQLFAALPSLEQRQLRSALRDKFRNISRIMDCVSCEKCRLWGKLQILGLGTAAKILLSPEREGSGALRLRRQEVVALINTLHQLSSSVHFSAMTLQLLQEQKQRQTKVTSARSSAASTTTSLSEPSNPSEKIHSDYHVDAPDSQGEGVREHVNDSDKAADRVVDGAVDGDEGVDCGFSIGSWRGTIAVLVSSALFLLGLLQLTRNHRFRRHSSASALLEDN